MQNFYFMRHAQTEANLGQVMCGGGVDTPLTPFGIEQAHKAQEIFLSHHKQIPAKAIIHSDMQRTQKTADIVNQSVCLPTFCDPNIKEHIVGDWEGKTWDETLEDYTKLIDPPNGETFAVFNKRVLVGINHALKTYETPLIVAHGGVWRAFLHHYNITSATHPNNAELYFFKFANQNRPFVWDIYHCHETGKKTKLML